MKMDKRLWNKLQTTKRLIQKVYFNNEYYIDSLLACFASKSNILLLGRRGGGKTHLSEALLKTIDPNITSMVQGYISADIEEVFARPDVAKLMRGEEEIVLKSAVTSRIKFFDEIQRLGGGAMSALFRLMTKGTIIYLDREFGVKPFWIIATANPTEYNTDTLNISIPEPLWDRFDGVIWIPIPRLTDLLKISDEIEELKENLPVIWNEQDILALWQDVRKIKLPRDIDYKINLMIRILSFCRYAQNYDASSIDENLKRELCSKCNSGYICSRIATPPSVRAKLALVRIAKGFAYLNGRDTVTFEDVKKAFPLVFWKRITFMNEFEIANRLNGLFTLCDDLIKDINEANEALELVSDLKDKYDQEKYDSLNRFVDTKPWLIEVKEELDNYFEEIRRRISEKYAEAEAKNDVQLKARLYLIARKHLPPNQANEFYFDVMIEVPLTNKVLAKAVKTDKTLYEYLKKARELGEKKVTLKGISALSYIAYIGEHYNIIS